MGKYFGTDGIRGKANDSLTVEMAFKVGQYLGYLFSFEQKGRILIGTDTRMSSSMFEYAIAAGAMSTGCDVYLLGVVPTPAVALLTRHREFDCGIMISASHNPFYDNGIKIFDQLGTKLAAEIENQIEQFIDDEATLSFAQNDRIGQIIDFQYGVEDYLQWLSSQFSFDGRGCTVVIDCANGSATTTAQRFLERFNVEVIATHCEPDGLNINTQCGSTYPQSLQQAVIAHQADVGFAFDGDADRLIAVDEFGNTVDGDKILYACGRYLKANGALKDNMVVTTVMSNLGLYKALEAEDIAYIQTQVGDKYVYDQMIQQDYKLGGEQSGHIIFKDISTTGDGLLTAVKLLEMMVVMNQSLSQLTQGITIFPQVLKNVPVKDKIKVMADQQLKDKIAKLEMRLEGNGRILVRPSGTEPLVRVMVEAQNEEICHELVSEVMSLIELKGL